MEDPHPTRRYPDQNFGLGSFFLPFFCFLFWILGRSWSRFLFVPCDRPGPIQNPKSWNSRKCISKYKKCHFGPPRKRAPKSQLNGPKTPEMGTGRSQFVPTCISEVPTQRSFPFIRNGQLSLIFGVPNFCVFSPPLVA